MMIYNIVFLDPRSKNSTGLVSYLSNCSTDRGADLAFLVVAAKAQGERQASALLPLRMADFQGTLTAYAIDPKLIVECMGSFRRGQPDCGDIDRTSSSSFSHFALL